MGVIPAIKGFQDASVNVDVHILHPGLLLDRYADYLTSRFDDFNQERGQKPHILRVIKANTACKVAHEPFLARWKAFYDALPVEHKREWTQACIWRLAAHLSRASTLENGAICLHPIYGFVYLPGSGMKGLARSWAHQTEQPKSEIIRILGSFDFRDNEEEMKIEPGDAAGSVVFLDAWPSTWPILECDIVNNHHKDYYANQGVNSPPGDWESPNPTYFLAVKPGTVFRFAVVARDRNTSKEDVETAASWLKSGLEELGAGAKTAAGYGYFS